MKTTTFNAADYLGDKADVTALVRYAGELEAENARLLAALRKIADHTPVTYVGIGMTDKVTIDVLWASERTVDERLRAALIEACNIALGTDLTREAVERVQELRRM